MTKTDLVLNFVVLSFEFVSNFGFRASNFSHIVQELMKDIIRGRIWAIQRH